MTLIIIIIALSCIEAVSVYHVPPREKVNDVLDYLNYDDLKILLKRLRKDFIGLPEQKRMIKDVSMRLYQYKSSSYRYIN